MRICDVDFSNNADLNNIMQSGVGSLECGVEKHKSQITKEDTMAWGVIVRTEFAIPRRRIVDLKSRLEELKEDIEKIKKEILVMMASDNSDYNKEDYIDKNHYIMSKFDDLMGWLEEAMIEKERIEIALSEDSKLEDY